MPREAIIVKSLVNIRLICKKTWALINELRGKKNANYFNNFFSFITRMKKYAREITFVFDVTNI